MAQSGRSNSAEKKATDDFILSSVLSHRTFGLTIAYEQSAHRNARSKISVQWWFRILKDRHSRRYDNKLIPRRANRLADDRNVGRSRGRLCQLLCSQFVISRPYRVWLSVWQCCRP